MDVGNSIITIIKDVINHPINFNDIKKQHQNKITIVIANLIDFFMITPSCN